MHVLLAEAVLLLGALYADDAQDTIANGDGHAQVGLGRQAHHGLAQLDRAARHILVDQQRLPHAEDVRREPSPKRDGRHFFTECVGEADEVRLRVVQRHINDVRREIWRICSPTRLIRASGSSSEVSAWLMRLTVVELCRALLGLLEETLGLLKQPSAFKSRA